MTKTKGSYRVTALVAGDTKKNAVFGAGVSDLGVGFRLMYMKQEKHTHRKGTTWEMTFLMT